MKAIEGYEGLYSISKDGRVWSHKRQIWLKPRFHNLGYSTLYLRGKNLFMHRLVALAYLPNPNNFPEVNHKNYNKKDNRVENLEWCTHLQNHEHRIGRKRLDEDQIGLLRCLRKTGDFTYDDLAEHFVTGIEEVRQLCRK